MKGPERYLGRSAEPEAEAAARGLTGDFRDVLVVPACGEGENVLGLLGELSAWARDLLVILVVNGRASAPSWVHEANRGLLAQVRRCFEPVRRFSEDPPIEQRAAAFGALLLVERTPEGTPLPEKQGVGLARKIGADVALRLRVDGRIGSRWIAMTDADAGLPSDYLARLATAPSAAVLTFPFEHSLPEDPVLRRAIVVYEAYLRYWVRGLREAGSPWSYHAVGSTLAVDAEAYSAVGGVPARAAGEDFYLMAKLAKIGSVVAPAGDPILLSARPSARVPFGTGRALLDQRRRRWGELEWPFDDPRLFQLVREVLGELSEAVATDRWELSPPVHDAVTAIGGVPACRSAIPASPDPAVRQRALHTWLDATRTLWLLRRHGRSKQPPLGPEAALSAAGISLGEPLTESLSRLRSEEATGRVGGID